MRQISVLGRVRIVQMLLSGSSSREVARATGFAKLTILRYAREARRLGIEFPKPRGRGRWREIRGMERESGVDCIALAAPARCRHRPDQWDGDGWGRVRVEGPREDWMRPIDVLIARESAP